MFVLTQFIPICLLCYFANELSEFYNSVQGVSLNKLNVLCECGNKTHTFNRYPHRILLADGKASHGFLIDCCS